MKTEMIMKRVNLPSGFNPEEHMAKAREELKHYTAIFAVEDGLGVASGTFVNVDGVYGILTANHVVTKLLAEYKEFSICLSDRQETGKWYKLKDFGHIVIGKCSDKDAEQQNGPDLSFLIICDQTSLATVDGIKSFYHLRPDKLSVFNFPLEEMPWAWAIVGCPYKDKVDEDNDSNLIDANYKGGPLRKLRHRALMAHFQARVFRDGFDYIELRSTCDKPFFPQSYQGMSGGGFWFLPLTNDTSGNLVHAAPVLAGVAFYQSDPPVNSERIITGHGYDSIYTRVVQTLNNHR